MNPNGECNGIYPNELLEWRLNSKSKFQNVPVEELRKRIDKAIDVLKAAHKVVFADTEVADLTEAGKVDELPEASCLIQMPFIYKMVDKATNRDKTCIMNASPEVVISFMRYAHDSGLVEDLYGDPERGFAGYYLKPW